MLESDTRTKEFVQSCISFYLTHKGQLLKNDNDIELYRLGMRFYIHEKTKPSFYDDIDNSD